MTVGVGIGSFLGFGKETDYGTAVTPDKFIELMDGGDGIDVEDTLIEPKSITTPGVKGAEVQQGTINPSGTLQFEIPQEGIELLLKHAMGGITTTQRDPTSHSTVYQHDFTIADELPTGLTMEIDKKVTSFFYEGCKINGLEISVAVNEMAQISLDIIAEQVTTNTATAEDFPTKGFFSAVQGVLLWNDNTQSIKSATISLANSLDADRFFIGSRCRKEPLRGDKLEVTGEFEVEFDSSTLYDDFRAAESRVLRLTFIGATISGGWNYLMEVEVPVAKLTGSIPQIGNEGIILYSPAFKGYRTGAASEMTIKLRNTVSSIA